MLQNSNETVFVWLLDTVTSFLTSQNFVSHWDLQCNFLLVEFLLWKCLNMWLLPTTPFLLFVQQMLVKAVRTNEVVTPFALNLLLDKSFKFSFIILHTHNAMQCRLLLPLKMGLLQYVTYRNTSVSAEKYLTNRGMKYFVLRALKSPER